MATTQEFYRNRGRYVRYSTKLNNMANGMYLTNQNIPEGYAKVMINYDIDDTGSCLKTRKGRLLHTTLNYEGKHNLGPMHNTDYIYVYDEDGIEATDIKDVIFSFGHYSKIDDYFPGYTMPTPERMKSPMFISNTSITIDTNVYDEEGEIINPGEITVEDTENAWVLYCDKGSEIFTDVPNDNVGYVSARTIKDAYVFDKKVVNDLGYPISTVMDNEIYAFAGSRIKATLYPNNVENSKYDSIVAPALSKLKINATADGYKFTYQALEPKELTVTEATAVGFNMLHPSPYVFRDVSGGTPRLLGKIVYADSSSDMPIFNPDVGTVYNVRTYYQYGSSSETYEYKVEISNVNSTEQDFTTVIDWTSLTAGEALRFDVAFPYEYTNLRISLRNEGSTDEQPLSQLDDLIDCSKSGHVSNRLEGKEFDLSTASGMFNWQKSIGLYGVKDAKDTIFFSDPEDASYFPYPDNTLTFDNEILAVHNYLDRLLVITTDSIYILTIGDSIKTSTQKKLMHNIFIPEIDAVNVVVLKDQIFFKTDTQFYVLKPNQYTSDATDLKNYINSTAISNYTLNFTEETVRMLNKVYRPLLDEVSEEQKQIAHFTDFDITNIQSIVKESEVHYVYTIIPKIGQRTFGNVDLHLIYNTITRSYRLYLQGIGDESISHTAKLYRNKQSGIFYEIFPHNMENAADILVVKEDINGRDDNIVIDDFELTPDYNNFSYLDTGNVALEDTYLKRFRELQLNLVNHEQSKIRFYTDFKVDGKLNISSVQYEIENITDPSDPDYGLIYVIPTAELNLGTRRLVPNTLDNLTLYGDTTLDREDDSDLVNYWEADLSAFPELEMATIRLKLWGKGRRGSFQMLCTDLKNYELSTMIWVYRIMNVR